MALTLRERGTKIDRSIIHMLPSSKVHAWRHLQTSWAHAGAAARTLSRWSEGGSPASSCITRSELCVRLCVPRDSESAARRLGRREGEHGTALPGGCNMLAAVVEVNSTDRELCAALRSEGTCRQPAAVPGQLLVQVVRSIHGHAGFERSGRVSPASYPAQAKTGRIQVGDDG
jgi:hypothetical protein